MSAAADAAEHNNLSQPVTRVSAARASTPQFVDDDDDAAQDGDDSEEEEEPKLKYDKLTGRLAGLYRNGDSTSAFAVAGNKMVTGTHNGNIHVLALPATQPLRTYQAHSATVTSCSISPTPPPLTLIQRADGSGTAAWSFAARSIGATKALASGPKPKATTQQPVILNTPDNAIFVATSSLDGHVCIFSLLDPKDVQLRNFARPVNAVALSPDYKSDRMYLSGGRAGQLILTTGGKAGVSSDANTNSAAAAASGWLGSIGLGSNTGKDTMLHQGEGNISTIKWSLSGKWVAWVNEEGIRIMRSHLRLGSEEGENAWRRIPYAPRPNRRIWEEMAGVWRARAHWVENTALEDDTPDIVMPATNGETPQSGKKHKKRAIEKLVVGWGDTVWILHIEDGATTSNVSNAGKSQIGNTGKSQIGTADIIHKLQFGDCVVSGLSLYSPSVVAILAYRTKGEKEKKAAEATLRKGRAHKHTGLAPQLRLINVHDGEELDVDELPMNRFETLSAQDYDVGSIWIPPSINEKTARESKGALEGLWEASGGYYAQKMLSSGASVISRSSSGFDDDTRRGSASARGTSAYDVTPTINDISGNEHQYLMEPGLKLFISSPYDCVIGVRRQSTDHLTWLLEHEKYAQAWALIDKQPDVADVSSPDQLSINSGRVGQQQSLTDFLGPDDSSSIRSQQHGSSLVASEKLRVGELWLTQLVTTERWAEAGQTASKVLRGSARWEHWILTFARNNRFDEISPFVPTKVVRPSISSTAYETILRHYIVVSPTRLRELVMQWDEGLFDASTIVSTIRARLANDEVKDGTDDWKSLVEALGHLYVSLANPQEALRCYIRTQNADQAFALLREERIADALSDNVPGFLTMKIDPAQLRSAPLSELDAASEQAVKTLVEEAHKSTVLPETVVTQLRQRGKAFRPFLYFYLRTLWNGHDQERSSTSTNHRKLNQAADEGRAIVEDYADLAVEMFAEYDRGILMEVLEVSEVYDYNRAATICEERKYTPELVLVLSRTGQTKRALWLIIDELGDATKAIAFAKQNPDLWEDLLEYGMSKPKFIRGLLHEVGTSIDPVNIVRRIPAGLEIEGLKSGILNLVQGWEVQLEVSRGVERVLCGEVLEGMATLRRGQRQGIRIDVVHETTDAVEPRHGDDGRARCTGCGEIFHEAETQPLLGFACGHVYHLSCLLRMSTKTSDPKVFEDIMSSAGYDDINAEAPGYSTRSVGAKVTHAHIIRNIVDHGCQQCSIAPS